MKISKILGVLTIAACISIFSGCSGEENKGITLRICNWEEYIDEGDWDEDEVIELDNGKSIIGVNSLCDDFEQWYYDTYGIEVNVEYSTFGTNEDIYNQLTMGDTFDMICPSDYMIMKLMAEGKLEAFSDSFYDTNGEYNYYCKGVSPYIKKIFENNKINNEPWSRYSAGYMWGTSGIVYNPQKISRDEVSHWSVLENDKYNRQMTIKDNVRDAYFAALAITKEDKLMQKDFIADDNYESRLAEEMNDTSDETISLVESELKKIKHNIYSFETDSGKSDMVTGKVLANYQWSGDAVYTMEQASEDGVDLAYVVPDECGNLWFDGWVMLKDGINGDEDKKKAAEAFVNFLSRPDNAVRNMYYIGYTSVISGGEDSTMYDYANWYYGAEEDEENTIDYDISYFFTEDESDSNYIVTADEGSEECGLGAQYPTLDTIRRCAVMNYFNDIANDKINQMWINVRCFNLTDMFK